MLGEFSQSTQTRVNNPGFEAFLSFPWKREYRKSLYHPNEWSSLATASQMKGLKATEVWSGYDMFCPTSLLPRTGRWVCLQRVHTMQEMVGFGNHRQAKNFRCGAPISSPPRESVTTWNHQSDLLECRGRCLLVFVSSVLHPGLTSTQNNHL